jgi:hypothetical protein
MIRQTNKARVVVISKNSMEIVALRNVIMSDPEAMSISHYAYSGKSTMATLPFTVNGVSSHIPHILETDFAVSVRQKVDLSACGPNEVLVRHTGDDKGRYDYHDVAPRRPTDLPPGFIEVYRKT